MRANKLIALGVGFVFLFFVSIYWISDIDTSSYKVEQSNNITTPLEAESLAGDSTADSYAALQAVVQKSLEENEENKAINAKLQKKLNSVQKDLDKAFAIIENKTGESITPIKKNIIEKIDLVKGNKDIKKEEIAVKPRNEMLVNNYKPKSTTQKPKPNDTAFHMSGDYSLSEGLGIPKMPRKIIRKKPSNRLGGNNKNDPNYGWVMPLETVNNKPLSEKKKEKEAAKKDTVHPAMTVSDNSILYDAVALTYMVGRIPVNGQVPDPYPVKLLVGEEILMANGYFLDGIEGMIFSGYATGDMNLNCVRAEMNSYTFIFKDGRQVTHREKIGSAKGGEEPMAYISDRFGLPCVLGSFVSNVGEFLSIQAALTGLSVAGEAYAASQTTNTTTELGGNIQTVSGDTGKYAVGEAVSGAVEDISDWMIARQENSFDAVVVPSGTQISLHLNRNIEIDYDEAARKVNYNYAVKNTANLD